MKNKYFTAVALGLSLTLSGQLKERKTPKLNNIVQEVCDEIISKNLPSQNLFQLVFQREHYQEEMIGNDYFNFQINCITKGDRTVRAEVDMYDKEENFILSMTDRKADGDLDKIINLNISSLEPGQNSPDDFWQTAYSRILKSYIKLSDTTILAKNQGYRITI